MKNLCFSAAVLATCFALAACNRQENEPVAGDGAVQSEEQVASAPAEAAPPAQNTETSSRESATVVEEPAPDEGPAETPFDGSSFRGPNYKPFAPDAPAIMSHYGMLETTVTLTRPVKEVDLTVNARKVDGAVPVASIHVFPVQNPRQNVALLHRQPVEGEQTYHKLVDLEPGEYMVRVTYFSSSPEGSRPPLEIVGGAFR